MILSKKLDVKLGMELYDSMLIVILISYDPKRALLFVNEEMNQFSVSTELLVGGFIEIRAEEDE